MAPLPVRVVVAACLFPALRTADAAALDSCTSQVACVEWTMTESNDQACTAASVKSAAGETCPGMWKVCMRIHPKTPGGSYASCPELMVRSVCPNAVCPAGPLPANSVVAAANDCGSPVHLPDDYCQYGKAGQTLKFIVQDGTRCSDRDAVARPQWPVAGQPQGDACKATVQCRPALPTDNACNGGCHGVNPAPTPCVHEFTIPNQCGCKARNHDSIESMPFAGDPLMGGLLAASGTETASASSSMLATVGAFCVASAAAVGVVVYRRLVAAASAEHAREMEPFEVDLTE